MFSFFGMSSVGSMNFTEQFSRGYGVTDFFRENDTDRGVNAVFLGRPAAAELHADQADRLCVDSADEAGNRRGNPANNRGLRQKLRVKDGGFITDDPRLNHETGEQARTGAEDARSTF